MTSNRKTAAKTDPIIDRAGKLQSEIDKITREGTYDDKPLYSYTKDGVTSFGSYEHLVDVLTNPPGPREPQRLDTGQGVTLVRVVGRYRYQNGDVVAKVGEHGELFPGDAGDDGYYHACHDYYEDHGSSGRAEDPLRLGIECTEANCYEWIYGWREKPPKAPDRIPLLTLEGAPAPGPRIPIRRASDITAKPLHWMWQARVPIGALTLLGGREDVGKSTLAFDLAARLTRGTLEGVYFGQQRNVMIIAAEDSWEYTIRPRLEAAGADLHRVITDDPETAGDINLPKSIDALERTIGDERIALVILDPLMSRLDGKLDSHKDAEVRRGLEPLKKMADRTGAAIIGLIHVNKSGSADAVTSLMGSRAFAAVARSVVFVARDPDNELRIVAVPKGNLGKKPADIAFTLNERVVGEYEGESISSSYVEWWKGKHRTLREVLDAASRPQRGPGVGDWMQGYLTEHGPTRRSTIVELADALFNASERTVDRHAATIKVTKTVVTDTDGRHTVWSWPAA